MNNDIMPGIDRPKKSKTRSKKEVAKLKNQEDLNLAIDKKWVKAQSALRSKNKAQVLLKVCVAANRITRYQIRANPDGSQRLVIVGLLGNKTTYRIAEESGSSSEIGPKNRLGETQLNGPDRGISPAGSSSGKIRFSEGKSKELAEKACLSIPVSLNGLGAISEIISILEPEFPSASPENCFQKPAQVCSAN